MPRLCPTLAALLLPVALCVPVAGRSDTRYVETMRWPPVDESLTFRGPISRCTNGIFVLPCLVGQTIPAVQIYRDAGTFLTAWELPYEAQLPAEARLPACAALGEQVCLYLNGRLTFMTIDGQFVHQQELSPPISDPATVLDLEAEPQGASLCLLRRVEGSLELLSYGTNGVKIAGIRLIVAGVLGLVYGSFSFTEETHEATMGPVEVSVKEKQTINIPVWAGVGAIAVGSVCLLLGGKKS